MYFQYQYTMNNTCLRCKIYILHNGLSRVKARPSDPLVYVWILWFFVNFYAARLVHNVATFLLGYVWFSMRKRVKIYWSCVNIFVEHLVCCVFVANYLLFFAARGVRKVTTGITGLWLRSVQSDAAFWFFDVGSSYPAPAYERKGKFVHLPTGNVSWV